MDKAEGGRLYDTKNNGIVRKTENVGSKGWDGWTESSGCSVFLLSLGLWDTFYTLYPFVFFATGLDPTLILLQQLDII